MGRRRTSRKRRATSTRRWARRLAFAAGLAGTFLPVPAVRAAEPCPNEPTRILQGVTYLPDCRAFEQVSPADEGAYDATFESAAADGGGVLFDAPGGLMGTAESNLGHIFAATRAPVGWSSQALTPFDPFGSPKPFYLVGGSEDAGITFVTSAPLVPQDTNSSGDLYALVDGKPVLLSHDAAGDAIGNMPPPSGGGAPYVISGDGRHVVFQSSEALTAGATDGEENIYEADLTTGSVSLVSQTSAGGDPANPENREGGAQLGSGIGPGTEGVDGNTLGAVSADGATVFFTSTLPYDQALPDDGVKKLFMRRDGLTSAVSASTTATPAESPITYEGAAADGSQVFFSTPDQLTSDDHNTVPDVYRYTTATGALTRITGTVPGFEDTGAGVDVHNGGGVVAISPDGSHVYFITPDQLTAQAPAGDPGPLLYEWTPAGTTFIAALSPDDVGGYEVASGSHYFFMPLTSLVQAARPVRITPDGSHLVFESHGQLTPDDTNTTEDVYEFSDTGGLVRISKDTTNPTAPVSYDATIGSPVPSGFGGDGQPAPDYADYGEDSFGRVVSDDGSRVFFSTRNALTPDAREGVRSIYEYEHGTVALVSPGGAAASDAYYQDSTPDASDVFFTTRQSLVPGDDDGGASDVYDARVDGGFPTPPAEPAGCAQSNTCAAHAPGRSSRAGLIAVRPPGQPAAGRHASGRRAAGAPADPRAEARPCPARLRKEAQPRRQARVRSCGPPPVRPRPQEAPLNRTLKAALLATFASLSLATAASAQPFAITEFQAGVSTSLAGAHPDATTSFLFPLGSQPGGVAGNPRDITVTLPPGLLGDATAVPQCPGDAFENYVLGRPGGCHPETQAGITSVLINGGTVAPEPVYSLAPARGGGRAVRLLHRPAAHLHRRDGAHGERLRRHGNGSSVPYGAGFYGASLTLWGVPADPSHDSERAVFCGTGASCEFGAASSAPVKALLTNPTACPATPPVTTLSVDTYEHPDEQLTATATTPPPTGCEGLAFDPSLALTPETTAADSPSGYEVDLSVPQDEDPASRAVSQLRTALVTLPPGVSIDPSVANGLQACSDAQFGMGQTTPPSCPQASILGSTEIDTPVLPEPLYGHAFVGQPLPGDTYRVFLEAHGDSLEVKLEGTVTPDPVTGQITATFDDLPQAPFGEFKLRLKGGATAPLATPPACGEGALTSSLTPWSGNPAAMPGALLSTDFDGDGALPVPAAVRAGLRRRLGLARGGRRDELLADALKGGPQPVPWPPQRAPPPGPARTPGGRPAVPLGARRGR